MRAMFDPEIWSRVPFHFWSLVFFSFGCIVGSFLNVCIYRMPRNESVVTPPSHCPHCNYSIPWFLNIPLFTWLYLRGKCANCRAPISVRYFLVELLTGVAFLSCWLSFGAQSALLALIYCVVMAGFIVATFIDFEHFIIPDEITIGGIVVGFICSFIVPELHYVQSVPQALLRSFLGIAVGGGLIYLILRGGKLLFGRQKIELAGESKIFFTETCLKLPDQDIPYDELFYRNSDVIVLQAKRVEMIDRCFLDARVRLTPVTLQIGESKFKTEETPYLEATTSEITLPREAMGFGDVKFMAAIGAFLGWQAVIFSLMVSSIIGSIVGGMLIAAGKSNWWGRLLMPLISIIGLLFGVAFTPEDKTGWSSRIPYGPYIALAATIWIFSGLNMQFWWMQKLNEFGTAFTLLWQSM
jgi:leader peptidase (prepilin peptidase) / N-methyltransferase